MLSYIYIVFLSIVHNVYAGKDPGYIELFTTHNASMDVGCIEFASPEWLTGTFVLPSLGQFEMKEERFTGLLDGFGKLASFSLSNNSLCYQSQMMDTGFYNDSLKAGKIAPSLMFAETIPKRLIVSLLFVVCWLVGGWWLVVCCCLFC